MRICHLIRVPRCLEHIVRNDALQHSLGILVQLFKQRSFVPEAIDFLSFVTACRALGRTNLLKTFVQTYSMQFIFSSYSLDYQRRITRLLLGLLTDGDQQLY